MKKENLIRANELERKIKEVNYFLTTIGDSAEHYEHKNFFINIETSRKISLFGSRWFGCGSRDANIVIPGALFDQVVYSCEQYLNLLEKEYEKL
jgi:hypothetical protein